MIRTFTRKFQKQGIWVGLITALIIASMVSMVGCSSSSKPTTPDVVIQQDLGDIDYLSDTTKTVIPEERPR